MIPPMLSSSPPPSDDDDISNSLDDSEEIHANDSSFDITGLSQKLQAASDHLSSASRSGEGQSVATCTSATVPSPTITSMQAVSTAEVSDDEWGDFNAAGTGVSSCELGGAMGVARSGVSTATDMPCYRKEIHGVKMVPETVCSDSCRDMNAPKASSPIQTVGMGGDSVSSATMSEGFLSDSQPLGQKSCVANTLQRQSSDESETGPVEYDDSSISDVNPVKNVGDFDHVDTVPSISVAELSSGNRSISASPNSDTDYGDFSAAAGDRICANPQSRMTCDQVENVEHSVKSEEGLDTSKLSVSSFGGSRSVGDIVHGSEDMVMPTVDTNNVADIGDDMIKPSALDNDIGSSSVMKEDIGDFATPSVSRFSAPTNNLLAAKDNIEDFSPLKGDMEDFNAPTDDFGAFSTRADDLGGFSAPANCFGGVSESNEDHIGVVSAPPDNFGTFSTRSKDDVEYRPVDNFSRFSSPAGEFSTSNEDNMADTSAPVESFGAFPPPADDFGDFSSAAGGGGFADFGSAFSAGASEEPSLVPDQQLAETSTLSDDEFGDFEDYKPPPQLEQPASGVVAVSAVLSSLFPTYCEDREPSSVSLDAGRVWHQLRDPEATAALCYRWSGSRANSHLLHALKVDANNVISFGGGWCVSVSGGGGGGVRELEALQPVPVSSAPPPTDVRESPQQQPTDVPAADFDWEGAGLKNPLEDGGLERELLRDDASSSSVTSSSAGALYNQLLQQTPPPLSEAAAEVVARIPNIDFMQARVLMFPVTGE